MNAQGVKNEKQLYNLLADDNYITQIKLDGMRAVVLCTSSGLRIFSRSAGVDDPTRPLEKTSALLHLAQLAFPDLEGTILDAEILAQGKDSAEIAGTVNRKSVDQDTTKVQLFVFDCLAVCGKKITDKPLRTRLSELLTISNKIQSDFISILPYATTTSQKRNLYERVIANGGEGIMLKNLNAAYVEGGRPASNWYKAKKSASFDCILIGFTNGKGKFNTQIGAVRFGQYLNGELVELGQASGMTDADRFLMTKYPEQFIGRVVTIKGMERLKSGAIRHPQFGRIRTDKKAEDCIWYRGEQ